MDGLWHRHNNCLEASEENHVVTKGDGGATVQAVRGGYMNVWTFLYQCLKGVRVPAICEKWAVQIYN